MISTTRRLLAVVLSLLLLTTAPRNIWGYQASTDAPSGATSNPTEAAPQNASQLQSLVAPIALYPDALVAQILTASTFPDQVAIANYWMQENKNLTGSALMQAVDQQSWDPSVKALTEFPSVLDNLAKNLTWTSSLGEAYHNQQSEVMTAIQALRAQAKAAGNLKSSSQITVVQQSPQTIVIQPTNPQVVYVPEYNPAVVYGTPYVTPGYSAADVAAAGIIGFGAGIAVGALMSGGCCGWGYSSWNCGWHGTAVIYHGGGYYGNPAWHGGYYNGGYHNSYGYNNSYNHYGNNYNSYRGGNTYNRNTVNVNQQSARNFANEHPSASNSWAQRSSSSDARSTAFSGMDGHTTGFGNSGGWSSRADSDRGWGSMRASGFSGGRFGGGRFGGGGFGGGFRR
ncbi:MAG TPA: DUF3300 domain-containing protein [Terriglobales bacterium]|nr:DUF3300 domain-containing protein [Terriglobales bacterium]